jgi:hypothetical protein
MDPASPVLFLSILAPCTFARGLPAGVAPSVSRWSPVAGPPPTRFEVVYRSAVER